MSLCVLLVVACMLSSASPYKHVVFMHGILAAPDEFDHFRDLVLQAHPGTPITQVDAYNHLDSLTPMWKQVENITASLKPILTNTSSEGTVIVCYSQGGLVCRGILSLLQHNVETMVALSSPLAGQYGDTSYLKYFFPNELKANVYKILYTLAGQQLSLGGYWNDPHQQALYRKYCRYLAQLNNETDSHHTSQEFKANFLRLKKLVLVGGPDDGVITPWQSSQFGYYNASEVVLPMSEQKWYKNDAFGLQTLDKRGAIKTYTIPGISHHYWHMNDSIFKCCVLPYLS